MKRTRKVERSDLTKAWTILERLIHIDGASLETLQIEARAFLNEIGNTCDHCARLFIPNKNGQRFCQEQCRIDYHNRIKMLHYFNTAESRTAGRLSEFVGCE